jgi:hypothetical protein
MRIYRRLLVAVVAAVAVVAEVVAVAAVVAEDWHICFNSSDKVRNDVLETEKSLEHKEC